jgi:competence ComEA-like helix-hairpin-helix protein
VFSLTKKEQIAVCFLVFCLLVGGAISLWKYHSPGKFADLRVVPVNPPSPDSLAYCSAERLDINSATVEQLTSLPGIGPKIAQRIIQWREENGSFQTVADIKRVKGIGAKNLEKLIPLIEVQQRK